MVLAYSLETRNNFFNFLVRLMRHGPSSITIYRAVLLGLQKQLCSTCTALQKGSLTND